MSFGVFIMRKWISKWWIDDNRRLPLRDAVEYRPTLDNMEVRLEPYRAALSQLKDFSYSVFSSRFFIPSLHVDYFRSRFPTHLPNYEYAAAYDYPYNQPGISKQFNCLFSLIKYFVLSIIEGFGIIRSDGECGLDGVHIRPSLTNCGGYEICLYGVWTENSCPEGLHWNVGIGNCDWPDNAKCTIVSEIPVVSAVETEVISPPTLPTTTSEPAPTESVTSPTESAPVPAGSGASETNESEINPAVQGIFLFSLSSLMRYSKQVMLILYLIIEWYPIWKKKLVD